MNIQELNIQFGGEELTLTNQRVVYWRRKNTLILSDLHLGKAAHFRKNGIPLPMQITQQDLLHLEYLLGHYQPKEVIIVGDLIHAGKNKEVDLLKSLTAKFSATKITLIIGNHDRVSPEHLEDIGIRDVRKSLVIDKLVFSHQPLPEKGLYCISGHMHPGVTIKLATKGIMKFPCFVIHKTSIVLPAFSRFTGLDTKKLTGKPTYVAFYEEGIFVVG